MSEEPLKRPGLEQVLTTTGIVDNLLHDAANVAIALSLLSLAHALRCVRILQLCAAAATYEVESSELGRGLVEAGVGREDGPASLTLVPDNTTHGDVVCEEEGRSLEMSTFKFRGLWVLKLSEPGAVGAPRYICPPSARTTAGDDILLHFACAGVDMDR
jgi:hypothetical protein